MKRLSDGEMDILAEVNADAAPSLNEAVAEWMGVDVADVGEDDQMRYLDLMRDEAPDWNDLYPTREPGGAVVPWTREEALSDRIPF